jgi:hypothetical protein
MRAKSFPKDLLEQATFLAHKESKRPKQASLRRAVSTAYYALFHQLCADGSELLAPNTGIASRHKIQRWFDHGTMKVTCGRFSKTPLISELSDLIGPTVSDDLRRVAINFVNLQNARHWADYDMGWNVNRVQTFSYIEQSKEACEAWVRIRKTGEANIFILSLFLWKHLETAR